MRSARVYQPQTDSTSSLEWDRSMMCPCARKSAECTVRGGGAEIGLFRQLRYSSTGMLFGCWLTKVGKAGKTLGCPLQLAL